jgi:hypothetical protein
VAQHRHGDRDEPHRFWLIASTSAARAGAKRRARGVAKIIGAMNPLRAALPVESEVKEERSNALKISTGALEEAVQFWRDADDAITARFGDERKRLIAERDLRRREVERLLWNLIVQREALGLAHHDGLWVYFRLPADLQPDPHLASTAASR